MLSSISNLYHTIIFAKSKGLLRKKTHKKHEKFSGSMEKVGNLGSFPAFGFRLWSLRCGGMVCDADGWLVGGADIFYPSWVVSNRHCLYCSEIPPAGAPPGFDYAAVRAVTFALSPTHAAPLRMTRKAIRDVSYNLYPSWIERKKRNDTWVVPYRTDKLHLPHPKRRPAERSKGGDPEVLSKSR